MRKFGTLKKHVGRRQLPGLNQLEEDKVHNVLAFEFIGSLMYIVACLFYSSYIHNKTSIVGTENFIV